MKKILSIILLMVMVATLFVGCSEEKQETAYDSEKDALVKVAYADLIQIPGYDYLYYSVNEQTVYYLFVVHNVRCFGPYIRNGHTCEYTDGQIIEIVPTVRIEEPIN